MNCVAGSEEQKELEALERLAARAALLETAKPLPPGESLQFLSHFGSILNNSMLLFFLSTAGRFYVIILIMLGGHTTDVSVEV